MLRDFHHPRFGTYLQRSFPLQVRGKVEVSDWEWFEQVNTPGCDTVALPSTFDHKVQPELVVLRPFHADHFDFLAQHLRTERKTSCPCNETAVQAFRTD